MGGLSDLQKGMKPCGPRLIKLPRSGISRAGKSTRVSAGRDRGRPTRGSCWAMAHVVKVDLSDPAGDKVQEGEGGGRPRAVSGSWMWEWMQSPASSRNSSAHGGNLFGPSSRNSSAHGGNLFGPASRGDGFGNSSLRGGNMFGGLFGSKEQSSPASALASSPGSRNSSLHGGNRFGKMKRNVSFSEMQGREEAIDKASNALKRNESSSWLWVWGQSPPASQPASRENSGHGGNIFAGEKPPSPTGQAPAGMLRRNSLSFLWDWAKYRESPPSTPGNSLHGGNQFGPSPPVEEDETEGEAGEDLPAIVPPKAMTRQLSIGSYMWNWGAQRASPMSSPEGSSHGGSMYLADNDQGR